MSAVSSRSLETPTSTPALRGPAVLARKSAITEDVEEGVLVSHTSSFAKPRVPDLVPLLVALPEGDEKVDLKRMLLSAGLTGPTRSILPQGKVYRIPVAVALNIATNGSGLINSTVSISGNMVVLARFSALASIFDEFFVKSFKSKYIPYNRYQITPGTTGSNRTSVPLHSVSLQHDATVYSSPSDCISNPTWHGSDTVSDYTHVWKNVESHTTGVAVSPDQATPSFTQSWCLTASANASKYTGQIQYLGPAGTAMVAGTQFGTLSVLFDVLWRCRR